MYGADSWVSQIPAETFASLGLNRVQVRVIDNAGRPHRINIFIENKLVILIRFCKTDPDPGSAFKAGLFADPDPYLLIMIRSKLNNITKNTLQIYLSTICILFSLYSLLNPGDSAICWHCAFNILFLTTRFYIFRTSCVR